MRRSPRLVLTALLGAAVLLTGCSGGGSDEDSSATSGEVATSGSDGGAQPAAAGGSGGGSGGGGEGGGGAEGGAAAPPTVLQGRVAPGAALVRTAELTVAVDDVAGAADEAARTVTAAGGTVESEERSRAGTDGTAVVVLRVPPRAFDATVGRLAELGEEVDRRLGTEDVTDQVVDLDSRISTQRASVARVSQLLDRARNLGEVVQIEGELTRRTADLESLQARLAVLEEQVDLSTITLRLHGEDGAGPVAGGPLGFRDGLAAGWDVLGTVARGLAVTAGAVLPFTPLLLLPAVLAWRSHARRARPLRTSDPARA